MALSKAEHTIEGRRDFLGHIDRSAPRDFPRRRDWRCGWFVGLHPRPGALSDHHGGESHHRKHQHTKQVNGFGHGQPGLLPGYS